MNTDILEKIFNIDKVIISNVKRNNHINSLISSHFYDKLDVIYYKEELLKIFSKFKSTKYLYQFIGNSGSSSLYDLSGIKSGTISNPVFNQAKDMVDGKDFLESFYNSIISLSRKLTYEEGIYLVETFLDSLSEEKIANMLNFSKTNLQKYKKSCLVKMWVELSCYIEK